MVVVSFHDHDIIKLMEGRMDGWMDYFFYDKSISSPIPKKISPLGRNSNIGVSNT